MKNILIIIFLFAPYFSSAQFIENKINIEIGTGVNLPLNNKSYTEADFNYPSLYGNYGIGIPLYIGIQDKINDLFWLGLDYNSYSYSNWKGDNELFVLENPTSKITSFHISASYLPKKYQLNKKYGQWGITAAPGIYKHTLTWDELNNTNNSDSTVYPSSFKETNAEMSIGLIYMKDLSGNFGISVKSNYKIGMVNNPYINDKTMHSFNLTLCLYYRAFKNRYFLYE